MTVTAIDKKLAQSNTFFHIATVELNGSDEIEEFVTDSCLTEDSCDLSKHGKWQVTFEKIGVRKTYIL